MECVWCKRGIFENSIVDTSFIYLIQFRMHCSFWELDDHDDADEYTWMEIEFSSKADRDRFLHYHRAWRQVNTLQVDAKEDEGWTVLEDFDKTMRRQLARHLILLRLAVVHLCL